MKSLLKCSVLLIVFSLACTKNTSAQTVNGVKITEINSPYIFVSPISRLLNNHVNLSINYGQALRINDLKSTGLLDRDEKAIKFNSIVAGLNYLYELGYKLDETLVDPTGGNITYILARSIDSDM